MGKSLRERYALLIQDEEEFVKAAREATEIDTDNLIDSLAAHASECVVWGLMAAWSEFDYESQKSLLERLKMDRRFALRALHTRNKEKFTEAKLDEEVVLTEDYQTALGTTTMLLSIYHAFKAVEKALASKTKMLEAASFRQGRELGMYSEDQETVQARRQVQEAEMDALRSQAEAALRG